MKIINGTSTFIVTHYRYSPAFGDYEFKVQSEQNTQFNSNYRTTFHREYVFPKELKILSPSGITQVRAFHEFEVTASSLGIAKILEEIPKDYLKKIAEGCLKTKLPIIEESYK